MVPWRRALASKVLPSGMGPEILLHSFHPHNRTESKIRQLSPIFMKGTYDEHESFIHTNPSGKLGRRAFPA
jgi:hypothetical protein